MKLLTPVCGMALALLLCGGAQTPATAPATGAATTPHRYGPLLNGNGGFEDGLTGYHFTRPLLVAIDDEEVFRGLASLRMQGEATTRPAENNMVVQGFAVPLPAPGKSFVFRIAVKAVGIDETYCPTIHLMASLGGGLGDYAFPQSRDMEIKHDCDWTPFEIVLDHLPDDAKQIGFWIVMPAQGTGRLWVDGVEFREIVR